MKTPSKSRRQRSQKRANARTKIIKSETLPSPGGKLGLIVDRLATKRGVTADELAKATGWQRHSVLGARSRLRARGFDIHLNTNAGRKVYHLHARKG